jgi:hypothetical protein
MARSRTRSARSRPAFNAFLPDPTVYLDDLLRTRERLATTSSADEWAGTAAAPRQEIS